MATPIAVQDSGGLTGSQLTTETGVATMEFPNDGKTMLYVENQDAALCNVGVLSVICSHGRTKDIVDYQVDPSEVHKLGPFQPEIFNDPNGLVQVTFSNVTALNVAAIRIAG